MAVFLLFTRSPLRFIVLILTMNIIDEESELEESELVQNMVDCAEWPAPGEWQC